MTRLAAVTVGAKVTAAIENADRAAINKAMLLITPTSVANGAIGTYGAVTCSAVTSVSLNGVFTSEFDWYVIDWALTTSAAAALSFDLRLAGVNTGAGWDTQRNSITNATNGPPAQSLNQASGGLDVTGVIGRHVGSLRLYDPALAVATIGSVESGSTANPMTTTAVSKYTGLIQHRTLTAYDGFTIAASSGNIAGTVRCYGVI